MERSDDTPSESSILILPPRTTPTITTATTTTATSENRNPPQLNNMNHPSSSIVSGPQWPTIDGPLGLSEQDSVLYARRFFKFGFLLLPWLWALNCFYFWPVLRHSASFPLLRSYVLGSAIGFMVFTAFLSSWALTFSIGGERLFGHFWDELVMYNVADRYGLTGWI